MECPYCGKEMESGHLTAGGYKILWTEKDWRLSAISGQDDVIVQRLRISGKLDNRAHLCRNCRRIVVEY